MIRCNFEILKRRDMKVKANKSKVMLLRSLEGSICEVVDGRNLDN